MDAGECMRDYTFIWTKGANKWLVDHEEIKKKYMIYAGFLMDMTQLTALLCFFLKI